jgi:hypothetical protein
LAPVTSRYLSSYKCVELMCRSDGRKSGPTVDDSACVTLA